MRLRVASVCLPPELDYRPAEDLTADQGCGWPGAIRRGAVQLRIAEG